MEANSELSFIKLPNNETLDALHEYNNLLKSIIKNKLISVTTFGGYTNYLCISCLEDIELKDEICRIINAVLTKLPCYNIYSGIITSSMLISLWSNSIESDANKLITAVAEFRELLDKALSSLKYECDILNVKSLQSALQNILSQEPAILLSYESQKKLSYEILKGVLAEVNINEGFRAGNIYIHLKQGSDYFLMVNGVICEVDDQNSSLITTMQSQLTESVNKMLLFAEDLDDSENFTAVFEQIANSGIKLIMCQKKICNLIKVMLRRNKVIALEQIGIDATKSVEQATGCKPVCNLKLFHVEGILPFVGYYTSVCLYTINNVNYLAVEKKGSNVSTLYIRCRTFCDLSVAKKICHLCIKVVYSMITSPYLLPGHIDFEDQLLCYFCSTELENVVIKEVVDIFCKTVSDIRNIFVTGIKLENNSNSMENGESYNLKRRVLLSSLDTVISSLSISMIVRK